MMRVQIETMIVSAAVLSMGLSAMGLSACSLVDPSNEDAHPGRSAQTTAQQAANANVDGGRAKADTLETSEPSTSCVDNDDCAALDHTMQWCSPRGTCEYRCEQGFGDGGADVGVAGCQCRLSNDGVEVCDGIDNDCDGLVDNSFRDGRVAAGDHQSCAVDAAGGLQCWGATELGAGRHVVERGATNNRFWQVRSGADHGCALDRRGLAFCWGNNDYGQVGPGGGRRADEPIVVADDLQFVDIGVGADHSCGLSSDGELYCWGRNDYGQLGDATRQSRAEPALVDTANHDFIDVAAGDFHTCALQADGDLYCWGANLAGQTGQPGHADVLRPTLVASASAFAFVDAGADHTCGLTGQGKAYCWGNNSYGQLGDRQRVSTHRPRAVSGDHAFLALSLGWTHSCGIDRRGRLFCWGSNADGRLGVDIVEDAAAQPQPVRPDLAFVDVAAGQSHTCAISRDGYLRCWGNNADGQIPAETAETRRSPGPSQCR